MRPSQCNNELSSQSDWPRGVVPAIEAAVRSDLVSVTQRVRPSPPDPRKGKLRRWLAISPSHLWRSSGRVN